MLSLALASRGHTHGSGGETSTGCPPPGAAGASERCIRRELGVPPEAGRVLMLSQSSHLDWDWLFTFETYFQRSVDRVLLDAVDLLSRHHGEEAHYF